MTSILRRSPRSDPIARQLSLCVAWLLAVALIAPGPGMADAPADRAARPSRA